MTIRKGHTFIQGDVAFIYISKTRDDIGQENKKQTRIIKPNSFNRLIFAEGGGHGHYHIFAPQPVKLMANEGQYGQQSIGTAILYSPETFHIKGINPKHTMGILKVSLGNIKIEHINEDGSLTGGHDSLVLTPGYYAVQHQFEFNSREIKHVRN